MPINDDICISIFGRIKDKKLEHEFAQQQFMRYKRLMSAVILALGVLYTLFLIPLFLTIPETNMLTGILVVKLISFAAFCAFAVTVFVTSSARVYRVFLTAFEFLFPLSYYCVVLQSGQFNFLIKCLDVIIIIALMFILPNNWINSTLAALFMLVSFFVVSFVVSPGLSRDVFSAGVTYLVLIFLVGCSFNLVSDISVRRNYLNRLLLRHLIDTDYLTGIASRSKFDNTLQQLFTAAKQSGSPLCVSVFDIDNFKKINDRYGHIVGDKVLIGLSALISEHLRGEEFFARWGGEEFALILPGMTLDRAVERIDKLRRKIAASSFADGISLTCSFGAVSAGGFDNTDALIDKADRLMYNAKSAGKDTVAYSETGSKQ